MRPVCIGLQGGLLGPPHCVCVCARVCVRKKIKNPHVEDSYILQPCMENEFIDISVHEILIKNAAVCRGL